MNASQNCVYGFKTAPLRITRNQRDRLLQRADRLAGARPRRDMPTAPSPGDASLRMQRVASRLRRMVAGVGRNESTLSLISRATERHVAGETGYAEWIEELRWCGLSAQAGYTRLSPADAARRQRNLTRRYPRLRRLLPIAGRVTAAGIPSGPAKR